MQPVSLWFLMWIYWFCAHPITGCVVLCTQNKKSQGKELNCPMAAAIIMGGVCVCCAPCICIGLCMGIEPLFRKTDVQMPQQPGVANPVATVVQPMGGPVVATATAVPVEQPGVVATATAMPMTATAVATVTPVVTPTVTPVVTPVVKPVED